MEIFCPFCTKAVTHETVECPSCGKTYGPATLKLLRRVIKETSQKHPTEQREDNRAPKTFKIAYPSPKALLNSYLSDISTGGLFIKTNNPPNHGERFFLKISLPDQENELKILCEVIWSHRKELVTPERTFPPEIGVKFLDMSSQAEKSINKILSRAAKQKI